MAEYLDPEQYYRIEYPDGWLPLTQEGSRHVSLASLVTGGYLRIEAYRFDHAAPETMRPERPLEGLLACEQRQWPGLGAPRIQSFVRHGDPAAYVTFTRAETGDPRATGDFGHLRAWVRTHGEVQVRCLYRCRSHDAGVDDDDLNAMIASLEIHDEVRLEAGGFARYYFSVLKRQRPRLAIEPPMGLALTLADGQVVLLEQLYAHYRLEPDKRDELIEKHIGLLDYCGDDVPDLTNYRQVRPLLFPKLYRAGQGPVPAHRVPSWPGLAVGAIVRGAVFTYGVNPERLAQWGRESLAELYDVLLENLQAEPPVVPRALRQADGRTAAISYVDHPWCASLILFEDFYETTAYNLGSSRFLVGLPDPSCVSCYRENDPRFVVEHTAQLRWDYHRSVEKLTDTVYLVTGPHADRIQPYDVLHCAPKKA